MMIVLDSSALTRGPRFDNFVADATARGYRIVVPHLVVLDVATRYRAESIEMITALSASARMYDRLGLRRDLTRFIDAAHDKADGYVQDLLTELLGIGVEIVEPVDVSHLEVAARALSMQRPYVDKKKRDGYPATLNWLTLLDLADRNPGVDVLWISDDTRAFGSTDDASWHDELLRELDARGVAGRVRWALEFPIFDEPVRVGFVAPEYVAPGFVAPAYVEDVPLPAPVVDTPVPVFEVPAIDVPTVVAPVAVTPKPVQRAARTRVAPQRILPAAKPQSGGLRSLGKVIGGRKRKVTIVEDLDEVDLFGN